MKIIVFSDSHGNEAPMIRALRRHKDIDAVLITTDGSFIVTGGLADSFKTTGSYKGTPITYI